MTSNVKSWEEWVTEDWIQHRTKVEKSMEKIEEIHTAVTVIKNEVRHLAKLGSIAETLKEVKDSLIAVVTGKGIVDIDTVKTLLVHQSTVHKAIVKTLCISLGTVVFVLIGAKILFPNVF